MNIGMGWKRRGEEEIEGKEDWKRKNRSEEERGDGKDRRIGRRMRDGKE